MIDEDNWYQKERRHKEYLAEFESKAIAVICILIFVPVAWAFSFFIIMHGLAVK